MSEFNFPTRYDEAAADEGVWTSVIDEMDNLWGRFKLCLFDETTQRYRLTMERLMRKYRNAAKSNPGSKEKTNEERAVEVFVELALVDWEITNKAGKAIPFSKEAAVRYLMAPQALYVQNAIVAFARDVRNFQPEEQTELPEGN